MGQACVKKGVSAKYMNQSNSIPQANQSSEFERNFPPNMHFKKINHHHNSSNDQGVSPEKANNINKCKQDEY